MRLNTLQPKAGAKHSSKRVGRGIGSTLGKTCGRGHKGQKSRAGGYHKVGFEGGQMPIQRRLPKFGFRSRKAKLNAQIRLDALNKLEESVIDFGLLQEKKLIGELIQQVKIIKSGDIKRAITVKGLQVTAGAASAIKAAGGKVE